MANYTAGSVTAEINLDTTKFKKAIESLKGEIKQLNSEFKSVNGGSGVTDEIKKLKSEINSLKKVNENYKKQLKRLREDFNKTFGEGAKEIASLKKALADLGNAHIMPKGLESFLRQFSEAELTVKRTSTEIDNAIRKFAQFSKRISPVNIGKTYSNNWDTTLSQLEKASTTFRNFENNFNDYHKSVLEDYLNKNPLGGVFAGLKEEQWSFFEAATKGWEDYQKRLSMVADSLKAKWHSLTAELAKANAAQYKYWKQTRGSSGVEGWNAQPLQFSGYNSYLQQDLTKMAGEVAKYEAEIQSGARVTLDFKEKLVLLAEALKTTGAEFNRFGADVDKAVSSMSRMAMSNEAANEISRMEAKLKHFSSVSETNSKALSKFGERITILKDKLRVLEQAFNNGKITERQYSAEVEKTSKDIAKLNAEIQKMIRELSLGNITIGKNGEVISKSSAEFKKMGNSMNQTAHSGRILSNTLYQIRGALLSLKMIFTAMGGMALWGFAMEIAEGVKETFKAKNEMEAQLQQNKKVDASGIQYFNKELNELTDTYKKINKYSIGETVSAIGLEFDLNAKQMAESLDVVSMIQSEYVRAGRKESEAALAVKDILQGEFQRLSRETGVGKDELLAYGWNGDKTDVEGLMKALRKAALDRHWDIFAKKATSLNDVMTILKSRMNETGADILQSVTPMIVEGFNMMIGAIEWLQKAFESLGPLGQNLALFGGGGALFTGILTALPMVAKGMGLADIATIGWGKSLATTALNLNKTTVAQYGFRKALAEVITGTKASDLANVRSTKAIMGRILGVKQSVLAEKGYMTALVHSKGILKNHTGATNIAKISSMGLAQKVAYLTNNMKLQDAQALGTGRAILKTATSFKVLKIAILGVTGIALVAWLSSVAAQAAQTKENIDAFNEIAASGYDKLSDARKQVDDYQAIMDKYQEGTDKYNQAKANKEIVKGNVRELETATQLVGSYKLQNKEREKNIKLATQQFRKNNLIEAGNDPAAATEKAAGWTDKIEAAQQAITNSYQKQYDWLEASSKHISANVGNLKAAGANQEQLNKYIYEYSAVAEEAGEHLKQFYQGDMSALAYYAWDRIRLVWIDISNHPEVVKLMNTLGDTWRSWQPTLKAIAKFLSDIGLKLVELANAFLSTDFGQQTALWATLAGAVGLVGWKFKGTIGSVKNVLSKFKTLGSKLKDLADKWKNVGDKAEEANEKMGGKNKDKDKDKDKGKNKDKDKDNIPSTSTGGINGDSKGTWWETTSKQLGQDATKYVRAAAAIAAGMLLISEAILMLAVPMWSLSQVGKYFKSVEPNIKQGIEGLKLIAPVMAIFLPPVVALMVLMDRFGNAITWDRMGDAFLKSAVGIAMAVTLVAEAIFLLAEPLIGLGAIGAVYGAFKANVHQGIEAIKATNEALYALVPWIPVFAAGIALAAITIGTEGIGGVAIAAAAAGIAIGVGLVTEAIYTLSLPLMAVARMGDIATDLDGVKRGAEALKVTAEALGYVEQAMGALAVVKWELLADYVAQLIGKALNIDLSSLTGEGGVFQQLEKFAQDFAKVNITPIDTAKAETLKTVAANIDTVSEALKTVKDAAAKLPKFGQDMSNNFGNGLGDAAMQGAEAETTDTASFFEQIKKPIEDLNTFVTDFNNMAVTPPDTTKVEAINQASSMITQVKSAVDNLNAVLGGAVDAGWNANMASGGIGAAVSGFVFGLGGGTGEYSSSLGTSLSQMYNAIKDIMTFTQKVNGLTGGGEGGNASVTSAVDMVTAVDNAIQNLQNTLSTAAPNVKESAKAIGTGIKDGVKEGMNGMSEGVIQQVTTALNAAKPYASTYGKGVGGSGKSGFQAEFKIKEAVSTELGYALSEMEGKKQEFYDKGYALGKSSADGFKAGEDSHSPGIIARTMFAEMGYVSQSLDDAISTVPQKAYALGNALATNFTPQFATDFGLTDMSAFETGLQGITTAANDTNLQTSMAFQNMNLTANTSMTGMTNSINGAFSNIQQNTTSRYSQLVSTTRVSLNNMQSQTTKNINAIKTSWKGMQNALIQSAENIRSETGSKIKSLENNMASFWSKVQNPSTLMQSAAGPINGSSTIRRRSRPSSLSGSNGGTSRRRYAAGPFKTGKKYTGITTSFNNSGKSYGMKVRNLLAEYLQCLSDGGNCAMGSGWSFNWSKDIQDALMTWHTHFGEIYDGKLRVGSFENDDFPVRGDADIFKNYVYDAISKTQYQGYFNSKCGDDPIAAYNSGHFNCWDGANIVMRLASAFGFSSHRVWGSWDGIPHVWAHVDGVGDIDATAIQGGYGLFASKVRAAGPLKVRNSSKGDATGFGDTHNYGDVNVTINVYGDDVEVNENKVDKSTAKQIIDILGVNPATGQ